MKLLETQLNPSFGYATPVFYYAKDKTGKVWRVIKPKNVKQCNSYVIRNLTGSKKDKDERLISTFAFFDAHYDDRKKFARSVYDYKNSMAYIVTGKRDCEMISSMAADIGILKSESLARIGKTNSFEVRDAVNRFFRRALDYVRRPEVVNKDKNGDERVMQIIFDACYKKDGSLKGFSFSDIIVTTLKELNNTK